MVIKNHLLRYHLLLILIVLTLLPDCRKKPLAKIRVVVSTSLIASIVTAVGDGRVTVTTIAPPGFCPGHFDLQPSTLVAANQAQLLLNHGWEGWWEKLKSELHNPQTRVVTMTTKGNWMIPELHQQATRELLNLLVKIDPSESLFYQKNALRYLEEIDSVTSELRSLFNGKTLPKVIAAEHQAPFLTWLGFQVVATYGRPEDWTARDLSRLAQIIVDSGVGLIVDNLQSGPDAGSELVKAAGIRQITLSNFPLEGSYLNTLMDNGRRLAEAIK